MTDIEVIYATILGVASGVGGCKRSRGGQRRKMYKEVGEPKKRCKLSDQGSLHDRLDSRAIMSRASHV